MKIYSFLIMVFISKIKYFIDIDIKNLGKKIYSGKTCNHVKYMDKIKPIKDTIKF